MYKDLSDVTKEMIRELTWTKQNIGCWEHKSVRVTPVGELIMILHEAWRDKVFNWTECKGPSADETGCKKHFTTEPDLAWTPTDIDMARIIVGLTVKKKVNLNREAFYQCCADALHPTHGS
jgi:hypothetical protein